MELQKKNQEVSIQANDLDIELIKELWQVNCVVSYPLSDEMVEVWSRCIKELAPDTTPKMIKEVVNKFKLEEIIYDSKKGIQNIFNALKKSKEVKRVDVSEIFGEANGK